MASEKKKKFVQLLCTIWEIKYIGDWNKNFKGGEENVEWGMKTSEMCEE